MRTLSLFLLVLIMVVGSTVYLTLISFSEHREYSQGSLDYYWLNPSELSAMSELCIDRPVFVYRSADGPKPTIVSMNCTIAREQFDAYAKSNAFLLDDDALYSNGQVELQITTHPLNEKITSIALIELNQM